jgi:hypothetical protein
MGSYGSSIISFLRKLHSAFCNVALICNYTNSVVPVLPHSCQRLLLLLPFNMAILTGVR